MSVMSRAVVVGWGNKQWVTGSSRVCRIVDGCRYVLNAGEAGH